MKDFNFLKGGIVGVVLLTAISCEEASLEEVQVNENIADYVIDENANEFIGPIPEATVSIEDFSNSKNAEDTSTKSVSTMETASTLTSTIEETLAPEESHTQTLTGTINGGPSAGDVMFVMDLTGSMGGELANAKANSVNIMNGIRNLIPDTEFGLVSHMDYNNFYSSCGYSAGYGISVDYPYFLDSGLTSEITSIQTKLLGLNLGSGNDGPESYTRALWELSNDDNIGWRTGSKKIAIAWLDYIPHDCNVFGLLGSSYTSTTGVDPGRDEIAGTADDLEFVATLEELASKNINLITLYSDANTLIFDLWDTASEITGGKAYQINSDGTIPGGTDIGDYIANLISANLNKIDKLTIEVCDPTYEDWFTGLVPEVYYDIVLDEPISRDYDVTITPPAGTPPGVYEFTLCLMGDGAQYAQSDVIITVPDPTTELAIDIHPTSCPNPIGLKNKGLTPVAINGSAELDVMDIDVSSITLEGVSPMMSSYEDVSTGYALSSGEELDAYDCHTLGEDGYMDLSLKFDSQQILDALGPLEKGDVLLLSLEGKFNDGSDFVGSDVIIIR